MQLETMLFADRSERGKLRFAGPQNKWFLHQITSQSFEDLPAGEARDATLLTAHGRMVGYFEAVATEDAVLCHFEPELRASFPDAIRRYVFATQVEIDDVSDEMPLVLLAGTGSAGTAASLATPVLVHPTTALGIEAVYLWCERARLGELLEEVARVGARRADEDELERIRIANGRPRWGTEMDSKTFPQEVGVDEIAVHYHKGCYVGQEAMAKIHFRGKVNRRLTRLESGEDLERGSEVFLDGAKVGRVTSAADGTALALVRYDVDRGAVVTAGRAEAKIAD